MRILSAIAPEVRETILFRIEDDPNISEISAENELRLIELAGGADSQPKRLILKGRLKFEFSCECARCLKKIIQPIVTEFESLIDLNAGTIEAKDIEAPPEEGLFKMKSSDEIDLYEELRQRVYLSIPHIIYCRSDCKGLCFICGCDLNVSECGCSRDEKDGQFSVLKKLLHDD